MTDPIAKHWDEANSIEFLEYSHLFIPDREEQIATLVELVPAGEPDAFLLWSSAQAAGRATYEFTLASLPRNVPKAPRWRALLNFLL